MCFILIDLSSTMAYIDYSIRDESSNENTNLTVNMRTVEIAPRDIFTLNNHVLFRVNNTEITPNNIE